MCVTWDFFVPQCSFDFGSEISSNSYGVAIINVNLNTERQGIIVHCGSVLEAFTLLINE